MKRFIILLSLCFMGIVVSCSNLVNSKQSTNIGINFNISDLQKKANNSRNSTEITGTSKALQVKVSLYEANLMEEKTYEYEDLNLEELKVIDKKETYFDSEGNASVTLNDVSIGIKAIIVAEIFSDEYTVLYAGCSNIFTVSEGNNFVDLEMIEIKKIFKVTFELFDGMFANYDSNIIEVVEDSENVTMNLNDYVPVKEGYIFEGWFYNTEPTGTPVEEITVTEDITLYARYRGENQVSYVSFSPDYTGIGTDTIINFTCKTDRASIFYYLEYSNDVNSFGDMKEFLPNDDGGTWVKQEKVVYPFIDGSEKDYVKVWAIATYENMENSMCTYAIYKKTYSSIEVTLPVYSDISGLEKPSIDGDIVTFNVPSLEDESNNYVSYEWYINGEYTATDSTWILDTSDMTGGIYSIMLVAIDKDGKEYSAEYQLIIDKSNN
ncbi:MAG: InlB B-repeat-containing protein [Treponema sp.]|nr:InlB B-repeat-containing protein [Treponema sp.]